MSMGYGDNNQNKRSKSNRTNGVVIAIVCIAMDLILLGVFGAAGRALVNFFVGVFGYAIYGYSFALTLLGLLMCFNVKPKQNARIILLYLLIAVLVIIFAHILVSHDYATSDWAAYIKQSYDTSNTAGGAIASIFLYPFATRKIYILSLVADGILAVGLIVIAILLQVNIDINLERILPKRRNRIAKGQNSNVGMFNVGYDNVSGVYLNNNTLDGKDLGENLSPKKGKAKLKLDRYVPIDRINVSQEQDFEIYGGAYREEDAQLILDTEEIKSEADRAELIYVGNDVDIQDKSVDIAQAQREIFGIDGTAKMPIVNEGMQDRPQENLTQDILSEQSDVANQNYDPSRYTGFSTSERLRIIAENERQSKLRNTGDIRREDTHRREDIPRPVFNEQPDSILHSDPKPDPDFARKLNIDNKSDIIPKENPIEFDFRTLKNEKKSDNAETFDAIKPIEPIQPVRPIKEEKDKSEDIKDIKDIIKDTPKKPQAPQKQEPVIDKTQTKPIESMDEFIANMNRQKKNEDLPEVKNYDVTKNVQSKTEKPQPTDGYFQKTFDPKPMTPPAKPTAPKQPIAPKQTADNKTADNKSAAVEITPEPVKTEAPKPVEKVKRSPYIPPSIDNLKDYVDNSGFEEDFNAKAKIIEETYAAFGIDVCVKNIVSGPTVTRFEFEVLSKIDVQLIRKKADNLLMELAVTSLRIEAPIPGKPLCGIEIPNAKRKTVGLKEFIQSDEFKSKSDGLYFALGKDVDNNCHFEDLTDFPHGLIAGGTGSGKSVCLNTMLCSLVYKYSPEELRIVLVDPKRVEFGQYKGLPHLLTPQIYNTPKESLVILRWLVEEMGRRYSLFEEYGVNKLPTFNMLDEVIDEDKKMPYILAIIDEVGDIMVSEYSKEFEALVITLAQKARACGIHLILATQRPSVDVITGLIKANMPTRIAFAVASGVDSKTILDTVGAEELLGKGDMLVKTRKLSKNLERLQNPFVDDIEIKRVMTDIIKHNQAYYDESVENRIKQMSEPPKPVEEPGSKEIKEFDFMDDLIPDVLRRIVGMERVSISGLQRAFSIGFSRGGKIYDWLLQAGYTEMTPDNKCVCKLTSEEVEQIIESARNGGAGDEE